MRRVGPYMKTHNASQTHAGIVSRAEDKSRKQWFAYLNESRILLGVQHAGQTYGSSVGLVRGRGPRCQNMIFSGNKVCTKTNVCKYDFYIITKIQRVKKCSQSKHTTSESIATLKPR